MKIKKIILSIHLVLILPLNQKETINEFLALMPTVLEEKVIEDEKRLKVFTDDFYNDEVLEYWSKINPNFTLAPGPLLAWDQSLIKSGDVLEAYVRSQVLPDYKVFNQAVTLKEINERIDKLLDHPNFRGAEILLDPSENSVMEEFYYFAGKSTNLLNQKLSEVESELKVTPSNMELFILGGSMESYYHYLKITGALKLSQNQIHHMPLSRLLLRGFPEETKDYLHKTMGPLLKGGKTILFFDTLFRGESYLTMSNFFQNLHQKFPNFGYDKRIILMGSPERPWDEIKDGAEIQMEEKVTNHINNKKSFWLVQAPTPGQKSDASFYNGTKYVFAELPHFVRGKYEKFINGKPKAQFLFPKDEEGTKGPLVLEKQQLTYEYKKLLTLVFLKNIFGLKEKLKLVD
jgi:hypothetical protein